MATPQQDLQPARDLVVADSTALTRSSDEDEATSSARRDGFSEPLTPPRPSLFALLSAEVLEMIARDIATGTLDSLLINDPVFQLARDYRLKTLKVGIETSGSILLKLATTPETALNVKELQVEIVDKHPELQCIIFRNTTNLTHLEVTFGDGENLFEVPDCFWWALRSLSRLVHLDVKYDYRLQPLDGFSFERDVPSLRKLGIGAEGSLAACAPGLSRLTHLKVSSTRFDGSGVPWQTLIHLNLAHRFTDASMDGLDLEKLANSLETACANAILVLSFDIDSLHGRQELVRIAESLPSLTNLAILDLRSFLAFKPWNFERKLRSVLRLRLSVWFDYSAAYELQGLLALLALFPALQGLRLECSDYNRPPFFDEIDKEKEAILTAIRRDRLREDFPAIADLLLSLKETTVLDFCLACIDFHDGDIGIRWRRFSKDEDFEAEGWTVI